MNKLLISTIALVALTTTVSADMKPFVGVNLSQYNSTVTQYGAAGELSTSYFSPSIKGGVIDETYRAYAHYETLYQGNNLYLSAEYTTLTINVEMIRKLTEEVDGYFGVHTGYGTIDYAVAYGTGAFAGLQYGVQGGVLFNITDALTVEGGAKYTMASLSNTVDILKINTLSLLAGINFRF